MSCKFKIGDKVKFNPNKDWKLSGTFPTIDERPDFFSRVYEIDDRRVNERVGSYWARREEDPCYKFNNEPRYTVSSSGGIIPESYLMKVGAKE